MFGRLGKSIEKLNKALEERTFQEMVYILGNKKEIFKRNVIAGIGRGVGIGIGVTIMTAIVILFLKRIVTLNIPIIGEYIADIVEIVEENL